MTWKCCVPGCKTSSSLPCHKFPKKQARKWLTGIGRTDLFNLTEKEISKLRICYAHFPEEMVESGGFKRSLKRNAFPCLSLLLNNNESSIGNDNICIRNINNEPELVIKTEPILENISSGISESNMSSEKISSALHTNSTFSFSAMSTNVSSEEGSLFKDCGVSSNTYDSGISCSYATKMKIDHLKKKVVIYQKKCYAPNQAIRCLQRKRIIGQLKNGRNINQFLGQLSDLQNTFMQIVRENFNIKSKVQ